MKRLLKIAVALFVVFSAGFILCILLGLTLMGPVASGLREQDTLEEARPEYGHIIDTRDGKLYYQQHGEKGPLVILAHGSGAWSQFWESSFTPLVEAGFRVVAFDMPPMGYSGPVSNHQYGRVAQSNRIADLIRHLGEKPILVGHSFGAGPMVEAAFRAPESIAGLVIVDGALTLNAHEAPTKMPFITRPFTLRKTIVSLTGTNPILTRTFLKQMVHKKNAITDRHIEILQRPLSVQDTTENASYWLESLLVPPVDALSTRPASYEQFTTPTRIIWGREDTITPLSQARALEGLLPQSELIILEDIGHIPHIEDPTTFNSALISALVEIGALNLSLQQPNSDL